MPQGHKQASESEMPSAARRYDKRRVPSYCDRVLVKSLPGATCERERQGAVEHEDNPLDHTPVRVGHLLDAVPAAVARADAARGAGGGRVSTLNLYLYFERHLYAEKEHTEYRKVRVRILPFVVKMLIKMPNGPRDASLEDLSSVPVHRSASSTRLRRRGRQSANRAG